MRKFRYLPSFYHSPAFKALAVLVIIVLVSYPVTKLSTIIKDSYRSEQETKATRNANDGLLPGEEVRDEHGHIFIMHTFTDLNGRSISCYQTKGPQGRTHNNGCVINEDK